MKGLFSCRLPRCIFRWKYFAATCLLFFSEVLIAAFLHDRFVRPYVGDFLVVILLYCFVRSFFPGKVLYQALGVLVFAFAVEGSQYFRLADTLGLSHHGVARIILGTSFAWQDILAYALGIALVLLIEIPRLRKEHI